MRVTKKQFKEFLQKKLSTDSKWALKALLKIYEFQTPQEKVAESTLIHNEVGFSGHDGQILSSMAKQYLKRKFLTAKQVKFLKQSMVKYWEQLLNISDKEKLTREYFKDCGQLTLF